MNKSVEAEESFIDPIFYKENDDQISFETIGFSEPIKFMKIFRWLFLIASIGLAGFAFMNFSDDTFVGKVISIFIILFSLSVGIIGFFVIAPLFQKIISMFGNRFKPEQNFFPVFDLKEGNLKTPNNQWLDFAMITRLVISPKKSGWFTIKAESKDGKTHFLLNCRKNLLKSFNRIEEKTNICVEKS